MSKESIVWNVNCKTRHTFENNFFRLVVVISKSKIIGIIYDKKREYESANLNLECVDGFNDTKTTNRMKDMLKSIMFESTKQLKEILEFNIDSMKQELATIEIEKKQ